MTMMMTRVCALLVAALALMPVAATAQQIRYGSNEDAAQRLKVDEVTLYYEVYGKGDPVLLLHGGLFGYLDEFAAYIDELSKRYKVIAPAMRGHGRSEVGNKPFSPQLQANEALAILKKVTDKPAIVIGFSHGATTAYWLTATSPPSVTKLVAIGNGLRTSPKVIEWAKGLTAASFTQANAGFVRARKQLMPHPEHWDKFLERLLAYYASKNSIPGEMLKEINCPVLVIGGDRDFYNPVEMFAETAANLANAQLLILPNCGHVDSLQRPVVLKEFILPFVEN